MNPKWIQLSFCSLLNAKCEFQKDSDIVKGRSSIAVHCMKDFPFLCPESSIIQLRCVSTNSSVTNPSLSCLAAV